MPEGNSGKCRQEYAKNNAVDVFKDQYAQYSCQYFYCQHDGYLGTIDLCPVGNIKYHTIKAVERIENCNHHKDRKCTGGDCAIIFMAAIQQDSNIAKQDSCTYYRHEGQCEHSCIFFENIAHLVHIVLVVLYGHL